MINLWKTVLPRTRAFSVVIEKTMRQFFNGLNFPDSFKDDSDTTYKQIDPQECSVESLEKWEDQFYLRNNGLTEQERRDRLEATWKKTGGQSPAYLQGVLRSYGFDVYVHDWWQPIAASSLLTMGDTSESFMGETNAFMGATVLDYPAPWDPVSLLVAPYYPLVNKITSGGATAFLSMGYQISFMGETNALMGEPVSQSESVEYTIPTDPDRWRHFIYIAGEAMPNSADVPSGRQEELEELILSIFPTEKWVGMIVNYV